MDIYHGDCLDVIRGLPGGLVDAVVTDPPAGISFMGKDWDHHRGGRDKWVAWLVERLSECLRVTKPGGHALVWALPRTSHWTAMAIEDAGWVIEDRVAHIFGQGFPKHKSRLKPAVEDWWLATKPGGEKWLGIDACRISAPDGVPIFDRQDGGNRNSLIGGLGTSRKIGQLDKMTGRWPTNLVLSHHPECKPNGTKKVKTATTNSRNYTGIFNFGSHELKRNPWVDSDGTETIAAFDCHPDCPVAMMDDAGCASRFFPGFLYCPKASQKDRGKDNTHPTVKPFELMRWLCKLVTPPGGTVLDPFAGSGSTGFAAEAEGFRAILVEQSAEYIAIIRARIESVNREVPLFSMISEGE